MRRGIHIAVAMLLAVLVARPFDCILTASTAKAADCCAKGKCLPKPDADDCCRATIPGDTPVATTKVSQTHVVPDFHASAVLLPIVAAHPIPGSSERSFAIALRPPGSPPDATRNLPLLI